LAKQHVYDFPRPAVTVDIALFTVTGALQDLRLQVLLIRRLEAPFRGAWALPGGFVREGEDLDAAARRELAEETGVHEVEIDQVAARGTPGRDPRGHVITILYAGLVAGDRHTLAATGDAGEARWFTLGKETPLPPLAFDHQELLAQALEHLRHRLGEAPICFELLPAVFTLSELQTLVEAILGRPLDRRNFRRRVLELGFLEEVPGSWRQGRHRPAQIYRFVPEKFNAYRTRERAIPF
jgi:8-oxo-dGTP diphosphatase